MQAVIYISLMIRELMKVDAWILCRKLAISANTCRSGEFHHFLPSMYIRGDGFEGEIVEPSWFTFRSARHMMPDCAVVVGILLEILVQWNRLVCSCIRMVILQASPLNKQHREFRQRFRLEFLEY